MVKNLPANAEDYKRHRFDPWVRNIPLEKKMTTHFGEEMATHFGILAWKIPWTEEPGGLQPIGSKRVQHD